MQLKLFFNAFWFIKMVYSVEIIDIKNMNSFCVSIFTDMTVFSYLILVGFYILFLIDNKAIIFSVSV